MSLGIYLLGAIGMWRGLSESAEADGEKTEWWLLFCASALWPMILVADYVSKETP